MVFKVYQTDEAEDLFNNEADAYARLPGEAWCYITQCYGTFIQNGKRTVILEYAEGGTLLDFFQRDKIPNTNDELLQFWSHLIELLHALHVIHGMQPQDNSEWILSG